MRGILVFAVLLSLLALPAFAFPTYTSNTHTYNAGTYGQTNIPTWISDETGSQLFDGDYGGYDWFENPGGVQSVEDYYARYDAQNGYGYGWVAWYADVISPTITFDMGSSFTFQQVGVHGYQRLSGGIRVPTWISISFSNDGSSFIGNFGLDVSGPVPEDSVIWKSATFMPTTARFIRMEFPTGDSYWIDEVSINSMDGAAFVPEPASIVILTAFIAPILLKRRRKER